MGNAPTAPAGVAAPGSARGGVAGAVPGPGTTAGSVAAPAAGVDVAGACPVGATGRRDAGSSTKFEGEVPTGSAGTTVAGTDRGADASTRRGASGAMAATSTSVTDAVITGTDPKSQATSRARRPMGLAAVIAGATARTCPVRRRWLTTLR